MKTMTQKQIDAFKSGSGYGGGTVEILGEGFHPN